MKKLFVVTLACTLFVCLSFVNAPAEPAAKVIWNVDPVPITSEDDWENILVDTINVPLSADLIISVSLECELKTNTLSMTSPLSETDAEIMVRVLVDDDDFIASPGEVAFARRFQGLVHNKPPSPDLPPPADPHNAVVVLYTTTASSFVFVAEDLDRGTHEIVVQAKVVLEDDNPRCPGHDPTDALINKGSVIVERVNMSLLR